MCRAKKRYYFLTVFGVFFIGTVLLDLEKFDLPSIAESVVENLVISDQLSQTDSNKVLAALLLRHRHQHQMSPIARRPSSYNLLAMARKDSKASMTTDDSEHKIVDTGEGAKMEDGVIRLKIDDSTDADDVAVQETSRVSLVVIILEGIFLYTIAQVILAF